MQEFILITILIILLFRVARRFIFFNAYQGFQKAAEDYIRKQQTKQPAEGTVTIKETESGKPSREKGGEYVDFEEIK